MLKKSISFFSQPYPNDILGRKKWALTFCFSFFVFLFLFLFQPFGLNVFGLEARLTICLGYGLACALAIGLNLFILIPLLPDQFNGSWTVGKQIFMICCILLTVSVFNVIYADAIGVVYFSWIQILNMAIQVVLVGIFPVGVLVGLDYLRLYRKHAKKAHKLLKEISSLPSNENKSFVLTSENENEHLQLSLEELLYLTSADNYVEVFYQLNGSVKRSLLRGTLKNFEKQLRHPQIKRCHRSYIVNLTRLINIKGNAQGYTIWLRGLDQQIPVSRSYADKVIQQIGKL